MSDPLIDFFEAPEAPARDATFRLSLMERVAKRRLQLELALASAFVVIAATCLWLVWPALSPSLSSVGQSILEPLAVLSFIAVVAFAGKWLATHRLRLPFVG